MSTTFSSPGEFTGSLNHQQSEVYSLQPKKKCRPRAQSPPNLETTSLISSRNHQKNGAQTKNSTPKKSTGPALLRKNVSTEFQQVKPGPPGSWPIPSPPNGKISPSTEKTPHPQKPVQCSTCDHETNRVDIRIEFLDSALGILRKKIDQMDWMVLKICFFPSLRR